jgi:ABC-2 type transport system permease protein
MESSTPSQRAAMLTAMLVTLLPSTILSGMVFPIASMPAPLQVVTNIVPARWFIVIARGIMLKGVGITHLWRETLVLVAMMVVMMTVAIRSFKPRMA